MARPLLYVPFWERFLPCTTHDMSERVFSIPDVRLVISFAVAIAFQACCCSRCRRASGGRHGSSSRSPVACWRLRLRSHERFGRVRDMQRSVRIPGQCAFSWASAAVRRRAAPSQWPPFAAAEFYQEEAHPPLSSSSMIPQHDAWCHSPGALLPPLSPGAVTHTRNHSLAR
jgi:hypothetical protein